MRNNGFTLIELIVAMAVLAIIAVYLLETFTVNNRTYVALDQTIEAQQNMRAIADLIERDVRHAGFMVPEAAGICGVDSTSAPDILYVSDYEAIDPGDDIVSYQGARILNAGVDNVTTGSPMMLSVDSLAVEPASPLRAAYDTDGSGTNDSDFQVNGGAIVADRNNPGRGVACGTVTGVDLANKRVSVDFHGTLGSLSGTSELVLVPAIRIWVDDQLRLFRNDLRLATGVEDFQVAYGFDIDGNGIISSSETRGAKGGTVYTASALNVEELREVRTNFVTRTRAEDPQFSAGAFLAMENRATVSGNDGYRRRVQKSTIMPRNLVNRMNGV